MHFLNKPIAFLLELELEPESETDASNIAGNIWIAEYVT